MYKRQVLEYIGNNKLYFSGLVAKRMSDERYYHSLSVASLSRLIAIANDVDPLKAFKAGLFHDIGKEVPAAKSLKIMEEHFPKYLDVYKRQINNSLLGLAEKEVVKVIVPRKETVSYTHLDVYKRQSTHNCQCLPL